MPRLDVEEGVDDDELDVWSSFSSESPVWQDDEPIEAQAPAGDRNLGQQRRAPTTRRRSAASTAACRAESEVVGASRAGSRSAPILRASRAGRPPAAAAARRRRAAPGRGRCRPSRAASMPVAIAVGLLLAVFLAALMYEPWTLAVLICIVVGLGAVEFYDKVSEKGYRRR